MNETADLEEGITAYSYQGWRIRFKGEWLYRVSHLCGPSEPELVHRLIEAGRPSSLHRDDQLTCYPCEARCSDLVLQHLMQAKKLLT